MSVRSDVDGRVARAPAAPPDKQMMIEAVKLLHPGRVVELRLLNLDGRGQTASGYFDQPGLLAEAALRYSRRAEGIYITLNPLPVSLLGRANNQVRERARQTTTDGEVLRRAWLPIDLDPRRPSGISASDHEHQAALEQARRIREWLAAEWGWHAPIFADSGNGAHLLYAIDLPNDAASADLLKRCLASLASRFETEAVTLDTSVYNAAHIWKLYGSVARKGESLPERSHRRAQIISAPDPVELVTREHLEALATMSRLEAGATREGAGLVAPASPPAGEAWDVTPEALLAWQEAHGARVRRTKQEPERTIYVLERCPFNPEHHAPGKACVILGKEGMPGFKCHAESCEVYHWHDLIALWGDAPHAAPAGETPAVQAAPPGAGAEAGTTSLLHPSPIEGEVLVALASLAAPGGGTGRARAFDAPRPWPEPPLDTVKHGLAGELVQALLPYTEADPLALLVQLLTAFGAAIGHGPHFFAGAGRHEPRLFSVLVGKSAKARKGESWQAVRRLVLASGEAPRIQTSLSSGEGLVWLMRVPVVKQRFIEGKRGQQGHYEQVVEDEGEAEKRVLVMVGELAQILKVMRREGNTLSPILRDAWDHGDLTITTKTLAARASSAYLSLIGHITVEELRAELRSLDAANGFANRFCWFAIRKSKDLAEGEPLTDAVIAPLGARFGEAVRRARQIGLMRRDEQAREMWREMYPNLARERAGFVGALTSRSEAQLLRLSMIYALLDGSPVMAPVHQMAATELWTYAERTAEYLFGDQRGDPLAEKIEGLLRQHGELSRKDLCDLLGGHVKMSVVDACLQAFEREEKAARAVRETGGRNAEVWIWRAA